jgi:hypothetical protein
LRQENGTLVQLLEQVRRLRTIYPDLPKLAEREIEVLHRLGRDSGIHDVNQQPLEEGS